MIIDQANVIDPILKELKINFQSLKTKDLNFRRIQLQNLLRGLIAFKDEIFIGL